MTYTLIILGLILLLCGGEAVVRGSVSLAQRLGVSPLIVGLTIVGFGTSLPEMVVSVNAALIGSPGLVVGNVIGSNIANILLILGVAALISPFSIHPTAVQRDALVMIAATLIYFGLGMTGRIDVLHGTVMLLFIVGYIAFTFREDSKVNSASTHSDCDKTEKLDGSALPTLGFFGLVIIGLILVVVGAEWLVTGSTELAMAFGVPEEVIGLSIIALGTSLPELATSIVAAYRGHTDLCVGNVLGSNIFNLFGITGVTALLIPLPFSQKIMQFDLWVLLIATIILLPFLLKHQKLYRLVGVFFLIAYISFIACQFAGMNGTTP